MSKVITAKDSPLLFVALAGNGAFSTICGVVLGLAARPVSEWMGIADPLWLRLMGPGLIAFGLLLLWLAAKRRIRRAEAAVISTLDVGWVIASAILVFGMPGLFTQAGAIAVGIVALVVLAFSDFQIYALWRTRSDSRP